MKQPEIVERWINYHYKEKDADLPAWEALDSMIHENPSKALQIIDDIISKKPTPEILSNLGAGPVEDMLQSETGSKYTDDIFNRARRYKEWRFVLGTVWTHGFKDLKQAKKVEDEIKKYFPAGRP